MPLLHVGPRCTAAEAHDLYVNACTARKRTPGVDGLQRIAGPPAWPATMVGARGVDGQPATGATINPVGRTNKEPGVLIGNGAYRRVVGPPE